MSKGVFCKILANQREIFAKTNLPPLFSAFVLTFYEWIAIKFPCWEIVSFFFSFFLLIFFSFFPSFLTADYVWPLWKKDEVCLLAWFTVHGDLHSFSMILCFSPLHLPVLNSKISWVCSNDICISIKWKQKYFLTRGKRNTNPKLHPASISYTSLWDTKYNIWSGHLPWVQYER